jgi:hypothetical protein
MRTPPPSFTAVGDRSSTWLDRLARRFDRPALQPLPPLYPAWRDALLILALFAASSGLIFLAGFAVAELWPEGFAPGDPIRSLCRWDCVWYMTLIEQGYDPVASKWPTGDGTNWGFFPLLPVVIRAAFAVTGLEGMGGAVVVSLSLRLLGLVLFFLYVRDLFGVPFARAATTLFALSPFAIHQSVPMSEAVFVPAAIALFWLARRGAFAATAVAAVALSAARSSGLFAVLSLGWIAISQFGARRLFTLSPGTETAWLALTACGLGAALFMLHLHDHLGYALAFSGAQVGWYREFKFPLLTLIDELNLYAMTPMWAFYNFINILFAAFGLWLAWRCLKLRLGPEALFVFIAITLGLVAGASTSLPRFTLGVFPIYVGFMALVVGPRARVITFAIAAVLQFVATVMWAMEFPHVM